MLVFTCVNAEPAPLKQVTFGAVVFPPYVTKDAHTQTCSGEAITTTREILVDYGLSLQVVCASALRIFRLMETAEVDLTVNVKSTRAMPPGTLFSGQPFTRLFVDLYTHQADTGPDSVAAIRGYDYHGYRQDLERRGFSFVDLPDGLDAVEMFLKGRTKHLISYRGPFVHRLSMLTDAGPKDISRLPLASVDSYYAISANSPYKDMLLQVFSEHASTSQLTYFYPVAQSKWKEAFQPKTQ